MTCIVCPAEINHYNDADVIAHFPGKTIAFEYQTSTGNTGNNESTRLMMKRQTCENRYGYVFFVGNYESVPELKKALQCDDIVISRGKQLEDLIDRLLGDPDNKKGIVKAVSGEYSAIRLEALTMLRSYL